MDIERDPAAREDAGQTRGGSALAFQHQRHALVLAKDHERLEIGRTLPSGRQRRKHADRLVQQRPPRAEQRFEVALAAQRWPKMALPMRTCVAPSSIAVSKSADMPIDSTDNPLRR